MTNIGYDGKRINAPKEMWIYPDNKNLKEIMEERFCQLFNKGIIRGQEAIGIKKAIEKLAGEKLI